MTMKTWDIAIKDMRLSFRSRSAIIFMFVVPILVTTLFAFMFGGLDDEEGFTLPQTAVVVANLDEGELPGLATETPAYLGVDLAGVHSLGEAMARLLQADALREVMQVTLMDSAAAARAAVDNQAAGVAVIIPANFTAALLGMGQAAEVELYQDPTLTFGPNVVSSVVGRFLDSFSAATIGVGVTLEQLTAGGAAISPEMVQAVVGQFTAGMGQSSATLLTVQAPTGQTGDTNPVAQILAQILGGMLVFYAFFTGANVMQSILTEEEKGTLQRLFTTPTSHLALLGGKFSAALIVLVVQVTLLLVFGRLVFAIHWGRWLPVALAAVGLILVAATAGLFLVSLMKSTRQAGAMFGGLLTLTGMVGMMSVFTGGSPYTPAALDIISLLVPQGWAVRGLRLAMEGGGAADLLLNLLALLLWSGVFFAIGQRRIQRRFAR
ncbi:MAG: ABC transporter permease [Chloroflexota bacterium]